MRGTLPSQPDRRDVDRPLRHVGKQDHDHLRFQAFRLAPAARLPDALGGRAILVRFLVLPVGRETIRFEQAFSADVGKTWETSWIATDTRIE